MRAALMLAATPLALLALLFLAGLMRFATTQ